MDKPNEGTPSEEGGDQTVETLSNEQIVEKMEKTDEQIANLNKGISGYRKENKELKGTIDTLTILTDELNKRLEGNGKGEGEGSSTNIDTDFLTKWAKDSGFVTNTELNTQTQKDIQDRAIVDFLKDNPDYDKDDEWKKFQAEFSLYRLPNSYEGYMSLFKRVLESLTDTDDKKKIKEEGKDEARAEDKTKSRLSLGGLSQGTSSGAKEELLTKLRKKYPNLTKAQIETRVEELLALPSKEEEKKDENTNE